MPVIEVAGRLHSQAEVGVSQVESFAETASVTIALARNMHTNPWALQIYYLLNSKTNYYFTVGGARTLG
jgi:hypothetical protein